MKETNCIPDRPVIQGMGGAIASILQTGKSKQGEPAGGWQRPGSLVGGRIDQSRKLSHSLGNNKIDAEGVLELGQIQDIQTGRGNKAEAGDCLFRERHFASSVYW